MFCVQNQVTRFCVGIISFLRIVATNNKLLSFEQEYLLSDQD